jgi:16S rRNA (cytidine1402-2'-O)-methyltransferase
MMPATLFLVATPIGNLEDVTFRALRTLREVAVIAAEDTRRTGNLLRHYDIGTPILSLHEHNERDRTPALIGRLQAGDAVALVSDAGTPLISDPGFLLVREAIAAGIRVEAIPGPSALTAALAVSGLPVDEFTFLGFPPARAGSRAAWLDSRAGRPGTLVLFEAPHRVHATLMDIHAHFGNRFVVVARELTKVHETITRGWVSDLLMQTIEERGEYVILVSDRIKVAVSAQAEVTDEELRVEFGSMTEYGAMSARDAVAELAHRHNISRQRVYKATRP